ncbi:hypothetical protein [Eikenella corrodens]|uniref:hypothetical protein n=1 Tax=Eikenella corrodens TaxID=539 RepID=UPI001878D126|nr:hypothetical protein [Eikenella corrodens]
MNILKLDYQGLPVHANREAWFNATGIAEQHGKRLDNFFYWKPTRASRPPFIRNSPPP